MLDVKRVERPASLLEACAMAKDGGVFLAGGTDVVPELRDGKRQGAALVDLTLLKPALSYIRKDGDVLRIGGLTRLQDICQSDDVQKWLAPLAVAAGKVGALQIRHRGTIGGNIVHASPAADTVPVLVAAGASVVLEGETGKWELLLEDFLLGPGKTAIHPGELLVEIAVPLPKTPWGGSYQKLGGRSSLTIATASVAVLHHPHFGYRVAYGSVTPSVKRAKAVEESLMAKGKNLEDAVNASISPIDDIRASGWYRRQVCVELTRLAWEEAKRNG